MMFSIGGRFQKAIPRFAIKVVLMALLLVLFEHQLVNAQQVETIDNDKVIELVKAGFGDDVLIPKIRQSQVMLDASQDALLRLTSSGVSNLVVVELLERAKFNGFIADGPVNDYLTVPYGTEVKVLTRAKLTSKKLEIGQKLILEIEDDVIINGQTVISRGTPVGATVVDSKKSGMMGRSGRLAIYIESTTMVNGQTIKLRAGKGGKDGDNMKSMFALTVLFGAPGLLMKGTNGQIPAGSIIFARIDETRYVKIHRNE